MRQLTNGAARVYGAVLAIAFAAGLAGCAMLETALNRRLEPPTVTATAARVVSLDFDGVDLELDVEVENPNAVGIDILGYEYHVEIAGKRVVTGDADARRAVDGGGATTWTVPASLRFASLLASVASLATEDETTFAFECAVRIDMPFVGEVTVPVTRIGALPLPKLPSISIDGVKLLGASATAADLLLKLRVDNPNGFVMRLESLSYELGLGDDTWVAASRAADLEVFAHASAIADLPVRVDLRSIGVAAVSLLRDPSSLPLLLSGAMHLAAPLPQMPTVTAPFKLRATDGR